MKHPKSKTQLKHVIYLLYKTLLKFYLIGKRKKNNRKTNQRKKRNKPFIKQTSSKFTIKTRNNKKTIKI